MSGLCTGSIGYMKLSNASSMPGAYPKSPLAFITNARVYFDVTTRASCFGGSILEFPESHDPREHSIQQLVSTNLDLEPGTSSSTWRLYFVSATTVHCPNMVPLPIIRNTTKQLTISMIKTQVLGLWRPCGRGPPIRISTCLHILEHTRDFSFNLRKEESCLHIMPRIDNTACTSV